MVSLNSDAFVFFGATGDLAYKQIFPALQAMVGRGHLHVPVIGVARPGWDIDKFRERAKDSIQNHGVADSDSSARLLSMLKYVSGDYRDAATACSPPWSKAFLNQGAPETPV
jgi:glucose-6-phosphate 1-dehydrogenase